MASPEVPFPLSPDLRDQTLARLGFSAPPRTDLEGLGALYAAWCAKVPFDNVRKMIALRTATNQALPGGQAHDFLSSWLRDGTGGTCWPSSNALVELACSLGFEAQRIVGCMRDMGVVSHASVRFRVDGKFWLADTSLLTNAPLPLDAHVFVHSDPVFAAEIEPVPGGKHRLWVDLPPNLAYMPCLLLADPASHALYLSSYEASRESGPFNQRLYARRNRPGELLVLMGHTRYSKTASGLVARELDAPGILQALSTDVGLSDRIIDEWVRCGGLEASLAPPAGPKPPPLDGLPPSKR